MRLILAARVAAVALCALFSGCATIVARSTQTMTVTSVPDGATLKITNKTGMAIHNGTTPATVTLKKGRGYFKPETYMLHLEKQGFHARDISIHGEVNGWYFGNILFGGLIGLLAVDPATGAMYTLRPKEVVATLDALKVAREGREQTLTVVLVENVPRELVSQLTAIRLD